VICLEKNQSERFLSMAPAEGQLEFRIMRN
jgi:hypothetical protein